jgi:opacity protein-like surface antigen
MFAAVALSVFGAHTVEPHKSTGKWYLTVKGTQISGAEHEGVEGSQGYGAGMEVGYEFANHFALEGMIVRATNDVTTHDEITHDKIEGTGEYMTYGLNAAYYWHATHNTILVGKVGLVNEHEKLELEHEEETADETGYDFGVGIEYEVTPSVELLVEYEHESIEGTRGDDLFLGAKYVFASH